MEPPEPLPSARNNTTPAPFGTLILGGTSTLTAGTLSVGLNTNGGSAANRTAGILKLGAVNVINSDNITIGGGKTKNTATGSMSFNNPAGNGQSVKLRGADGTSPVATLKIGDASGYSGSSGTNSIGVVDLTGGSVDALITTLQIGIGKSGSNTAPSTGSLTFNAGSLNATNITLGVRGTSSGAAPATGTLTINGTGSLVAANGILLGDTVSGSGSGTATGILNINGGSVTAGGDIVDGGGTSTVTLNGGTLDLQGHNLGISGGAIDTVNLQTGTLRSVGEFNGGVPLNKNAAGTLTMAGNHTYTGSTEINNGVLAVTGTLLSSGNVNVNTLGTANGTLSGTGSVGNVNLLTDNGAFKAMISPGVTSAVGSVGTLTMSSLNVGGGDFRLDLLGGSNNDKIVVNGPASFNGLSTITANSTSPVAGTYTILTATSLSGIAPSAPAGARINYVVDFGVSVPNTIKLTVSGGAKTLTWTGAAPGDGLTWDVQGQQNWSDNGGVSTNEKFFNQDSLIFDDVGAAHAAIALNAPLSPGAVTINSNTGTSNYTISGSGSIDGNTTTLTKNGNATLTINTGITYSGTTTINAGVLTLTGANSGNSTFTVNGGTLNFSGTNSGGSSFTINASGTMNLTGDASASGALSPSAPPAC